MVTCITGNLVLCFEIESYQKVAEIAVLCPRNKMAEGHIEFTLCVCVCVCVCMCVCVPGSCPTHNFIVHGVI